MSTFSNIVKNFRRGRRDMDRREQECMTAIVAVLKTYNCTLRPVLKGDDRSILADVQIEALPPTTHDLRINNAVPAGPGSQAPQEATERSSAAPNADERRDATQSS